MVLLNPSVIMGGWESVWLLSPAFLLFLIVIGSLSHAHMRALLTLLIMFMTVAYDRSIILVQMWHGLLLE